MITPRFSCSQTAESVIISIYCPAIRASDVEIHVEDTLFTINVNPYFLRLNFSHRLLEDDESSVKYDPSSGYLTVTLSKEVKGQEFKDLDLLVKLLAPRPTKQGPVIEVIPETSARPEDDLVRRTAALSLHQQEFIEAAKNDWRFPQTLHGSLPLLQTSSQQHYGFLDMYSGYFKHVTHTENEVNELGPDIETCKPKERREKRKAHEDKKWDEEHYMADYVDDGYIQELLVWKHPYVADTSEFQYTEEENLSMLRLPRKEYLPTPLQTHSHYLILVTILFAYAYDARTTQCDPTPESAWTICSLTPAFSALDPPPYSDIPRVISDPPVFSKDELSATLIQSYRRSLAFPLYRSFTLAEACRADVGDLLSRGKRVIFRCLLNTKQILDHHEVYYIYSKVWVDDFCVWVQAYARDDVLMQIGTTLKELTVKKKSIGWELEEAEAAILRLGDIETDSDDE